MAFGDRHRLLSFFGGGWDILYYSNCRMPQTTEIGFGMGSEVNRFGATNTSAGKSRKRGSRKQFVPPFPGSGAFMLSNQYVSNNTVRLHAGMHKASSVSALVWGRTMAPDTRMDAGMSSLRHAR